MTTSTTKTRTSWAAALVATSVCVLLQPVSSQSPLQSTQPPPQEQMPTVPSAAIPVVEAAAIAQYWVLIAEGKFDEAAKTVGGLVLKYPRSIAVLTLLVETDIARGGALTALTSYETWLGSREVEEPGVLRRIARAVLYEWARQAGDTNARNEALVVLAGDGDAEAGAAIARMQMAKDESGLRMSVRLGDPVAVDELADRVRQGAGLRLRDMQLLAESRSPRAVPVLMSMLKDPSPEIRSAAADGLGNIGGVEAELALQPMLTDPHGVVRTSVSAALFRLGNFNGAALLHELAGSEHSAVRRSAAKLMASQPDESWKTLVRGLLNDPDPSIRLDAAVMIAPHDPAAARSVLDVLNNDPNPAIREATQLAEAAAVTVDLSSLRGLIRKGDPLARIRAAARVLAITR